MIIKKTVAINPMIDHFIRKMWSILIEAGYDASYSTALNYMLLEHIRSVAVDGVNKDISKELSLFLNDEKTTEELDLKEYATKVDELLENRQRTKDLK